MTEWYLYILRCVDGSLYTGITKDTKRRIHEHNHDNRLASAYTRSRRPVKLVYREPCKSRAAALAREAEIKRMKKKQKEKLLK